MRILLACLALIAALLPANAWFTSRDSSYNISIPIQTGCSPACPGDLALSSITAWDDWYSTGRCFSKNTIGPIIDLADTSTGTAHGSRINCAANGVVSVDTGVNCAWATGTGGQCEAIATTCAISCDVKMWYSQTASPVFGNIFGAVGARIKFAPSVLNSAGCLSRTGSISNTTFLSTTAGTQNQPLSVSLIGFINNTSALGGVIPLFANNADTIRSGFDNVVPPTNHMAYAGATSAIKAQSNASFHAFNDAFNGVSSIASVDGSASATLNAGSNNITSSALAPWRVGDANMIQSYICEMGLAVGAMSTTDMGTLSSNQHSAYGIW